MCSQCIARYAEFTTGIRPIEEKGDTEGNFEGINLLGGGTATGAHVDTEGAVSHDSIFGAPRYWDSRRKTTRQM